VEPFLHAKHQGKEFMDCFAEALTREEATLAAFIGSPRRGHWIKFIGSMVINDTAIGFIEPSRSPKTTNRQYCRQAVSVDASENLEGKD
jgi:hypothetical protein